MRILINAVSSATHPSGICRHAANLARSISKREEVSTVRILIGWWQEHYFRSIFGLYSSKLEISVVHIANHSLDRNRWYLQHLPRIAKAHSPDIVHLSFPIPVVERFPCPLVASLHDLYPYDAPGNFGFPRVIFNRLFLRLCLRGSDAIACGSDFTLNRLRSLAPKAAAKAIRIYQSVELRTKIVQRPPLPEVDGRPFFLSVAQHRSNKNLELLLNAFSELLRRGELETEMCLLIVGAEGPETRRLKDLVNKNSLQRRVYFKTSITDPELCWLYTNCTLFLAPSMTEGFGMPVIEALQCNCRIVCSDIPVFREIAGAACHYVDLRSDSPVHALADAANSARHDQPRKAEMLNRFSEQEIAAQYAALYSKLLAAVPEHSTTAPASLSRTIPYDRYAS